MTSIIHTLIDLACLKCDHFPLTVKATDKTRDQQELNTDFIINFISRLDYEALKSAANDVNFKFFSWSTETLIVEY